MKNPFSNSALFDGGDIAQKSSHEVKKTADFGNRHNCWIRLNLEKLIKLPQEYPRTLTYLGIPFFAWPKTEDSV